MRTMQFRSFGVRLVPVIVTAALLIAPVGVTLAQTVDTNADNMVVKADQTISFGTLGDKHVGDADFTVSATSSSWLDVSFTAEGSCTITDGLVHIEGAGTCTITATQCGDDTYNAAPTVTQSFQITEPESQDQGSGQGGGSTDGSTNNSGGSSGNTTITGGGSFATGAGGGGSVLGASTTTVGQVLGASCGIYLTDYLRKGYDNNPDQVKKLQDFLNRHLHSNLTVSGIFDDATFESVNQFQLQNLEQVLAQWVPYGLANAHTPTGYVYKTTLRWINMTECADLNIPMPQLP